MALLAEADDPARRRVHGGESCGGAVAFVVVGHGLGPASLQRQTRLSAVLGLHRGWLLTLKVSERWGLSPWTRQMRRTLVSPIPLCFAIRRVLQWVAWAGFSRVVNRMTSATLSGAIKGRRPGRGASFSKSGTLNQGL
jgi:hypothetical protein